MNFKRIIPSQWLILYRDDIAAVNVGKRRRLQLVSLKLHAGNYHNYFTVYTFNLPFNIMGWTEGNLTYKTLEVFYHTNKISH